MATQWYPGRRRGCTRWRGERHKPDRLYRHVVLPDGGELNYSRRLQAKIKIHSVGRDHAVGAEHQLLRLRCRGFPSSPSGPGQADPGYSQRHEG